MPQSTNWPWVWFILAVLYFPANNFTAQGCSYVGPSPFGLWVKPFLDDWNNGGQTIRSIDDDPNLLWAEFLVYPKKRTQPENRTVGIIYLTTCLVTKGPPPNNVSFSSAHTPNPSGGYELTVPGAATNGSVAFN